MGKPRLLALLTVGGLLLGGCAAQTADTPRPTSSGVSPETAALAGIYRWSNTLEQTKGTPAEGAEFVVPTDTELIVAPNTFTLTLDDGQWSMVATATPRHDGGTYTADGTTLSMEWTILPAGEGPYRMEYTYAVSADGSVTLTPKFLMDPVDGFVFSTNPWIKIG